MPPARKATPPTNPTDTAEDFGPYDPTTLTFDEVRKQVTRAQKITDLAMRAKTLARLAKATAYAQGASGIRRDAAILTLMTAWEDARRAFDLKHQELEAKFDRDELTGDQYAVALADAKETMAQQRVGLDGPVAVARKIGATKGVITLALQRAPARSKWPSIPNAEEVASQEYRAAQELLRAQQFAADARDDAVRELIEDGGWSNADVARLCGLKTSRVSQIRSYNSR